MLFRKRTSTPTLDLTRLCPASRCINGVRWTTIGPAEACDVCQGNGRVTLSEWMKFQFVDARDVDE